MEDSGLGRKDVPRSTKMENTNTNQSGKVKYCVGKERRRATGNKNNSESQVESLVMCDDHAKKGSKYSQQW